jgi:hypothetical protein
VRQVAVRALQAAQQALARPVQVRPVQVQPQQEAQAPLRAAA